MADRASKTPLIDRRTFLKVGAVLPLASCQGKPGKRSPGSRRPGQSDAPRILDAAAPTSVDATAKKPTPAVRHEVTMFRGNPAHTFYGTGPLANELKVKWRYRLGTFVSHATEHREEKKWSGTGWTGTAICVNDRVYIGSLDSRLYCFDSKDGRLIWRYQAGRMFKSSACFYKGRIYIGNVDNYLHCVDADTGKRVWRWNSGQDLDSSACVVENRLYIGGEAGFLNCLHPDNGKVIWRKFLGGTEGGGGSGGVESSPAVVDGRVYASNFSGYLFCHDALSGKRIWRARTFDDSDVSPVVAHGRVWTAAQEKAPYLYCFDAKTGKRYWRFNNNMGWWSTPALVGDRLFAGGQNYRMYCLHAFSGAKLWEFKIKRPIWSSPAVVDDKVVFGAYDRNMYMLSARDGSLIWKKRMPGRVISSPCIVRGRVYIGTATGWFYCLGPA